VVEIGRLAARDDRPAVIEPGRDRVSYAALDRLADGVAAKLCALGVEPGDAIGLYARRSADAIAVMLGALRAGAVYVPVDPAAPVARNVEILADCAVRMTIVEEPFAGSYRSAASAVGGAAALDGVQSIGEVGAGGAIRAWAPDALSDALRAERSRRRSDIACILYTSGTTGRHKGWRMTRTAIETFAGWAHGFLGVDERDVFASHAPFHFAMSLFDVYASTTAGARIVLVPDDLRAFASPLVDVLVRERATVFFATPSILSLVAAVDDLEARDLSALRLIVFGGEVFPAPPLRTLVRRLRGPRYFNCWGSTETNIATHYELRPETPLDQPPPIGRPSSHYEARVIAADGGAAPPGTIGELQLRGAGLTGGYLNRPELNAERFVEAKDGGPRWYRTCDLVIELAPGELRYAGRIGRMVKIRGHRVEPGEIEARLYEHPRVREAGVVAVEGPRGVELVAHLAGERIPIVELKQFCAVKLPSYMIPARFVFHDALPRTSRGKMDFERLRAAGE
jgi:amino acid adenylation domain-containing protein